MIGKTGYTRPAGRCFVGAASADGREIASRPGLVRLWATHGALRHALASRTSDRSFRWHPRPAGAAHAPQITEGDEDTTEQFKRGNVHIASVDRGSTRGTSAASKRPSVDRYTVRLGPYGTRHEAESAKSRLAKRGYRARVVGQALMLGEFTSRDGADRFAKGLKSKGYRPTIVGAR